MTHFGTVQTDQYDAFGMRAVKATTATHPQDAGTTYYLYDGDTQIAAANLNGKILWVNAFGATGLLGEAANGGYHLFYTFDTTGNIAQRWNSTSLDSAYGFDGYGQPLPGTVGATYGNYDPHTGYSSQAGGYYDYDTSLVLMGHRYYDPASGRFLNRDPSGYGGGINLYSYTQNNPVNDSDPLGLQDMGKTYQDDKSAAELEQLFGYNGGQARNYVNANRAYLDDVQENNAEPFEYAAEFAAGFLVSDGIGAAADWAGDLLAPSIAKLASKPIIKFARAGRALVKGNRSGSALTKQDLFHKAPDWIWLRKQAASKGSRFMCPRKQGSSIDTLFQIPGSLNNYTGRYEYIVTDEGNITHQLFVQNGTINGIPTKL